MATLHLMVGLPCSGKTTLAKQLEQERSALRLTPDEWQVALFGQDAEEPEHDGGWAYLEVAARRYCCQCLCIHARNLTRTEWAQYIGDAMPYQAVCDNLPIEPKVTTTPPVAP